jgi:hypothetical protein
MCTKPPGTFKTITNQSLVSRKDPGTKWGQAIEPLGSTAGFAGAILANGGRRGTGQGSVVTSDSPRVDLWDVWMWTGLRRWPAATRGSVARDRACSDELSAKARVRAGWAAPLRVRHTGANRPVYHEYRWYRWPPVPVCTGAYRSGSNALNLNSKKWNLKQKYLKILQDL